MTQEHRIRIDMSDFIKQSKRLLDEDWPEAIVKALSLTTKRVQMVEQAITRESFKLHSEWIPKNIQAFPKTIGQKNKLKNDFKYRHEGFASVMTSEKISYMIMQETGADKMPHGRHLAIPGPAAENYSFLTSTGKVKGKWQPKTLLNVWNQKGGWTKGSKHPGERGTGKKAPFVIKDRNGDLILARRKSKKSTALETLYIFKSSAKIKPRWHFEERGYNFMKSHYQEYFDFALRTVLKKYSN